MSAVARDGSLSTASAAVPAEGTAREGSLFIATAREGSLSTVTARDGTISTARDGSLSIATASAIASTASASAAALPSATALALRERRLLPPCVCVVLAQSRLLRALLLRLLCLAGVAVFAADVLVWREGGAA